MAKILTFNFEDKEYTLEFTRNTVKAMESQGFNLDDIDSKPMTILPRLFAGAFLAHHAGMKQEKIDKIYSGMKNRNELIIKLAEMYQEPINALLDDPEGEEGNISWGANW